MSSRSEEEPTEPAAEPQTAVGTLPDRGHAADKYLE